MLSLFHFWKLMTRMFSIQLGHHMFAFMKYGNLIQSSIGLLCLWLVWIESETKISAILCLLITGGILVDYVIQDFYGGSMKYLYGSEKALSVINIGVLEFGIAFMLLLLTLTTTKQKPKIN